MRKKYLALVSLTLISSSIYANAITTILPNSETLQWKDAKSLPPGAKITILTGNPEKKEFYVALLKMPANYVVPSHSHQVKEYSTVISGTYYLGEGDSVNKNATIALPAGSFISCPAGAKHYGFTKEETILEISGNGAWGTIPTKLN